MALQKQNVAIDFSQGLDTKTDPFQLPVGKFLNLENAVFNIGKLLSKRNGYGKLPELSDTNSRFLTTFNGNLTAIGTSFQALSEASNSWVNKGFFQPAKLQTLPLIRSNLNQTQSDTAVAANGLVCTVFSDYNGSTTVYKYAIADSVTGQNIVAPTLIPVASGVVTGAPRVFLLGNYFILLFTNFITATNHLQYVAISVNNPTNVSSNVDVSATYAPATTLSFDAFVVNSALYIAWNGSAGGGAVHMKYLSASLTLTTQVTFATEIATIMSVCADVSGTNPGGQPVIYAVYYNLATTTGHVLAVDSQLNTIHAPTTWISSGTILNVTSSAQSGSVNIFYEVSNAYSYDGAIATNFVNTKAVTQAGSVGSASTVLRSVGLASKSFILDGSIYMLVVYSSGYQPSYFLIKSTGSVIGKISYSNGSGYKTTGLPEVSLSGTTAFVSYLIKDLVQATNKTQGATSNTPVYSQTGINLATVEIGTSEISSAEIGGNLNITGDITWAYDGYVAVEQGFHLYPDYVEATTAMTGGFLKDQIYFYVATYEWADNQGNIFRSAPSIPFRVTTTGGDVSANTINVPTLRITYKTANPVKIVIYRWSTDQQTYYQVTSITAPTLNSTSSDSIAFVDTLADASILGNNILYTTGGVIENVGAPSFSDVSLYRSRLFGIDSEDDNLLWYSKQVIEATPVEMSDLFTIFVAPTTGAQGSSGGMKCIAPLDDKLIIFKRDAIYYIVGNGPDNTGANNDFSEPVFVTSTVGSENKRSIVFMPKGLMFQSDKGIWLLGRDLSTQYIGAPVQGFTDNATVDSAVSVPGTNQVRFTLSTGITLMYDYYYDQWGVFTGVPCVSSTLYENLHTFVDQYGRVFQETPNVYKDGSNPVLMKFTTGWLNFAGLQGYQRIYYFDLLGKYISPHKLNVQIAYDYNSAASQQTVITPDNYNAPWGGDSTWGSNALWGGQPRLEAWKIFTQKQQCQAFQITLNEIFDASYDTAAGAGLTISGLNCVIGIKKAYRPSPAKNTVG